MEEIYFSKEIEKILEKIDYSKFGRTVAIKLHFGEKGCTTYMNPEIVRKVYNKIKSLGKEVCLVECNVLYKGSRTNSTEHIKTAREHGFDMPIDILDGENGQEFISIKGCKLGKKIKNYDSLIVLTHFKGHMMAGFGGALKNLAMGFASRVGKLDMHSLVKPSISKKCTGCGVCIKSCNVKAISIVDGKAKIDKEKCEGCAMCIAVCNNGAVSVPWGGRTSEGLQKRIAEYASAVLGLFPNAVFINVLENITKDCDCIEHVQKPIMKDVGILYSKDAVAIDKASLDLTNKLSNNKFNAINPINKNKQIEFAEDLKIGTSNYKLIDLDKLK